MGKVESKGDSVLLASRCDGFDVECLSRVVVDTGKHHESQFVSLVIDSLQHIVISQRTLPFPEVHHLHHIVRIEPMPARLCLKCVQVGGESGRVAKNLVPAGGGPIEGSQQEVEIRRQGVHEHDLDRLRTDQPGSTGPEGLVIGKPGVATLEVPRHCKISPRFQFCGDIIEALPGHQSERVATEVDERLSILPRRNMKPIPELTERVIRILRSGILEGFFVLRFHQVVPVASLWKTADSIPRNSRAVPPSRRLF